MAAASQTWDLHNLARAHRLVRWTTDLIAPHVRGRVAEVGAGIGTYSERLLASGAERMVLLEPDTACVAELRARFDGDARVEIAEEGVPESPLLRSLAGQLDAVVSQNVIEHVADDAGAVRVMAEALAPGGTLVLQVPANPRLYGALDRVYEHHRRYSRASIRALVEGAGLEVVEIRAFNLLGIAGWLANRNRAAPRVGPASLRVYELLVRVWRPIEDRLRPPWGLSWIVRARRPA